MSNGGGGGGVVVHPQRACGRPSPAAEGVPQGRAQGPCRGPCINSTAQAL